MVLAGGGDAFGHLRVRVDRKTWLGGGRFRRHAHDVNIAIYDRRGSCKTSVEQTFLQHLIETSERRSLMRVVVKHLLLSYGSECLDGRCLVSRPDGCFPTGHADSNQDADDGDNDHQLN